MVKMAMFEPQYIKFYLISLGMAHGRHHLHAMHASASIPVRVGGLFGFMPAKEVGTTSFGCKAKKIIRQLLPMEQIRPRPSWPGPKWWRSSHPSWTRLG